MVCNGYREIDVLVSASYRIELRRWPRVEDLALIAYRDIKDGYGGDVHYL